MKRYPWFTTTGSHPSVARGWAASRWWVVLLLAGVGLALVGWFAFGPPRAEAQTFFDRAQCEAGGNYLPADFRDEPSPGLVADCRALIDIAEHFLTNVNNRDLTRNDESLFGFENWGRGANTTIDTWRGEGANSTNGVSFAGGLTDPPEIRGRVHRLILPGRIITDPDDPFNIVGINGVSGTLPPALSNLTALRQLNIQPGNLVGSIPDLSNTSLTSLRLGRSVPSYPVGNQLTGPIPDLPASLNTIFLDGNRLTGPIPDLSNNTGLLTLDLSNNRLTGRIPDLSANTSLITLNLFNNRLTGPIPALPTQRPQSGGGHSDGSSLRTVNLSSNRLTDPIPDLSAHTRLRTLNLSNNRLNGPIPDLTVLTDNRVRRGIGCPSSNFCRGNGVLDLGGNQLTGSIDNAGDLSTLENLVTIHLDNNRLTGEIPMLPPYLTSLQLQNNQLTGSVPTANNVPDSLTTLRLEGNLLTGNIPDLDSLSNLRIVSLAVNQLDGSIPDFHNHLVTLDLGGNQLTGMIPASLYTPAGIGTRLYTLYLGGNQLTGMIPSQLGMVSGVVHPSFGQSLGLRELDLSFNQFTGAIPSQLGDLSGSLAALELGGNDLTGEVPAALRGRMNLPDLDGNLDRQVVGGNCLPTTGTSSPVGSDEIAFCDLAEVEASGDQSLTLVWSGVESERVWGFRYIISDGTDETVGHAPGSALFLTIPNLENEVEYTIIFQVIYDEGDYSTWTRWTATPRQGARPPVTPVTPVTPVSAVDDGVVSNPARFSACVGVEGGGGFTDVVGSFAETDVGCIAQFGITQGRTATMFAPEEVVSRWQMALFLARAAGPAGVGLADPALDQGFTDIGGLSEEAQQAANALAAAGIMPGITTQEFRPNVLVTRSDMALLLDAFLDNAAIGTGGTGPDDVRSNDNVFTDIEDVPVLAFNAISRIYELGITRGTTETTFSPDQLVTRAQMAAFIARTLAHTQARPAGITIQPRVDSSLTEDGSVELLVSVRDTDFQPVVDALVDLFSYTAANADQAFDTNGRCTTSRVDLLGEGTTVCQIDFSDNLTDTRGDFIVTVDSVSNDLTVVSWTGDDRDVYDDGTTNAAMLRLEGARQRATQIIVSDNLAGTQQLLQFGDTFQLTLQVAGSDDTPIALAGQSVRVAIVEEASDETFVRTTRDRLTDSTGRIVLPFTQTDSDRQNRENTARVEITLSNPDLRLNYDTASVNDFNLCSNDVCTATWSDLLPEARTLHLSQDSLYTIAGNGVVHQVIATLTDQYGDPIRGEDVEFTATNTTCNARTTSTVVTDMDKTNRRGQARFVYNRNNLICDPPPMGDGTPRPIRDVPRTQDTITATHMPDEGEPMATTTPATTGSPHYDTPTVGITQYWVTEEDRPAETNASRIYKEVRIHDTANNRIIFVNNPRNPVDFRYLEYDDNDFFNISQNPVTMAAFKQALEDPDTDYWLRYEGYSNDEDQISNFELIIVFR